MRKDGFDIDDIFDSEEIIPEEKKTIVSDIITKDENKKSKNIEEINNNKVITKINNNTKINKNIDDNIKKINNISNIKKDLIKDTMSKEETRGRKKSKNKKDKAFTSKLYGKQKETIDSIKNELEIETDYELLLFLLKKSTVRNNIDIDLFFIK